MCVCVRVCMCVCARTGRYTSCLKVGNRPCYKNLCMHVQLKLRESVEAYEFEYVGHHNYYDINVCVGASYQGVLLDSLTLP